MRTVAELRDWAGRQWQRHWPRWLSSPWDAEIGWPLHPPTQREMAANPDAVAFAVGQWRALDTQDGVEVEWVERRLGPYGRQCLPARVTLTPAAVADLVGHAATWDRAMAATGQLRTAWPELYHHPAISSVAKALGALSEDEVVRLMSVLGWMEAHPSAAQWERAIPVKGVDTKWVEQHRLLVQELAAGITGSMVGFLRPAARFAVRLPPEADGPREFSADLNQLAAMEYEPRRVLIVENLVSLAMLPPLPGVVAVHGKGFAAPTLAEVPWLAAAQQWYWGDLDTYGFQILGRVRAALPGVRSVLMDCATFHAHAQFAGTEPAPFRGEIGHLTADEHRALRLVRSGDHRLEQERLPEATVAAALRQLVQG